MSKVMQIYEDDLGELERALPELADAMMPVLNNRLRMKLRQCKQIISNVRWNYGPPAQVEVMPTDDPDYCV